MNKKIAIVQSNYIPWKGYFDLINMVDEFILYDDAQYTRRDWRNRNKIKTPQGAQWITIPVKVKGKYFQKIKETEVVDQRWGEEHWATIKNYYSKAPFFNAYKKYFEELYLETEELLLCKINYRFIISISKLLGISTKISWSSDYDLAEGKSNKLIGLCKQAQATKYISGPAAKNYIDEALFEKEKIELEWMDYSDYPDYNQLFPPFENEVSIIDLLFNEGSNSTKFMKSFSHSKF